MSEEKVNNSVFLAITSLAGVIGFILGALWMRSKASNTAITEFTRDEAGRILTIMERVK